MTQVLVTFRYSRTTVGDSISWYCHIHIKFNVIQVNISHAANKIVRRYMIRISKYYVQGRNSANIQWWTAQVKFSKDLTKENTVKILLENLSIWTNIYELYQIPFYCELLTKKCWQYAPHNAIFVQWRISGWRGEKRLHPSPNNFLKPLDGS